MQHMACRPPVQTFVAELMLLDPAVSHSSNAVLLVSVTLIQPKHVESSLQASSSAGHKSVAVSSSAAELAPARCMDMKTVAVVATRSTPDDANRRRRPPTIILVCISRRPERSDPKPARTATTLSRRHADTNSRPERWIYHVHSMRQQHLTTSQAVLKKFGSILVRFTRKAFLDSAISVAHTLPHENVLSLVK